MKQVPYLGPTNVSCHLTQFGRHGGLAVRIYASLFWAILEMKRKIFVFVRMDRDFMTTFASCTLPTLPDVLVIHVVACVVMCDEHYFLTFPVFRPPILPNSLQICYIYLNIKALFYHFI